MPAVFARAGAKVHDVVGSAHYRFVMLHDEHRVSEVAQPLQRLYQPVVVGRMQPDGRLVAHIQHAHQAGAYLRGQPYALRLAAAESGCGAREREVVEADVQQEVQPRSDFLEYLSRDCLLPLAQRTRMLDLHAPIARCLRLSLPFRARFAVPLVSTISGRGLGWRI